MKLSKKTYCPAPKEKVVSSITIDGTNENTLRIEVCRVDCNNLPASATDCVKSYAHIDIPKDIVMLLRDDLNRYLGE